MTIWPLANSRSLSLGSPKVIGILNLTPDSFADGGRYPTIDAALAAADQMAANGAAMLDIGGESTRPGSVRVSASHQLRRVISVIQAIRAGAGPSATLPISIDTTLAPVASAALAAGADAINDVSGGDDDPAILTIAAQSQAGLILMYRPFAPGADSYSDQYKVKPTYEDITTAVTDAFVHRLIPRALAAGVSPDRIIIDPGLGFGKTVQQNLQLITSSGRIIAACNRPLMSALSRKSFVGRVSLQRDSTPDERLAGTLALSVLHFLNGATLFRVHDVRPHVEALNAVRRASLP